MATGGESGGSKIVFRSLTSKVAAFGSPFYSFSIWQAATMTAAYGATLLAFAYAYRRELRLDPLIAASLVFVVLFLLFPNDIGGAGGTDVRWLIPAYLLPFCVTGTGTRPRRTPLGIALAACLLHAGVVWSYVRTMDRQLDEYDLVLRQVPPESRLLPLISDQRSYPRVGPYQQYSMWHIIRNRGYVPGLWSLSGTRAGEPRVPHLRHFDTPRHMYYPPFRWGSTIFSPLDWNRIAAEYDYIVQVSDDDRARAYVAAHAREKLRVGAVTLYEVVAPRAGSPRATLTP